MDSYLQLYPTFKLKAHSFLILRQVYTIYVDEFISQHYCSLKRPCLPAHTHLSKFFALRLISSDWNRAYQSLLSSKAHAFFSEIERVYYPYPWHINTRVRRAVLMKKYRIYRTIQTEYGDRGVFLAYNFGTLQGCVAEQRIVVKAWADASDKECVAEQTAYTTLKSSAMQGIPKVLDMSFDTDCDVFSIALEKLGPSLDDVLDIIPDHKFDERMVMCVAIQMIERCKDLHAKGVMYNGLKPANICLSPHRSDFTLYAIDFGCSFSQDISDATRIPHHELISPIGNRQFMSILGHHGFANSPRDDLESLGYLLSFLYHGSLPWNDRNFLWDNSKPRSHNYVPRLWSVKISTTARALFGDMPPCFMEYWKEVRCLAFGETPNYDALKFFFESRWNEEGYGDKIGLIDWWKVVRGNVEEFTSG